MARKVRDLEVNAHRESLQGSTGIWVRAKDADGKWVNADIATLTPESLLDWLHSRGDCNRWAESTVFLILGVEMPQGDARHQRTVRAMDGD